jgi:hypothetical protein
MESVAASIIQRAVEKDKKAQYTTALVLYQEGLQILIDSMKGTLNSCYSLRKYCYKLANFLKYRIR